MGETVIIYGNPNHSGYANFLYTGSRYLNPGNKTQNKNVNNNSLLSTSCFLSTSRHIVEVTQPKLLSSVYITTLFGQLTNSTLQR